MPGTSVQFVGSAVSETGLGELTIGAAATHAANWGIMSIVPRHLDWNEATAVLLQRPGRLDIVCSAVAVLGTGSFQASEDSLPVPFQDGAVIVRAGGHVKLFAPHDFYKHFVDVNGSPITSYYQVGIVSPQI